MWVIMIGMIAGLALQCGPVAAHGKGHATQAVTPARHVQTPKVDDVPVLGVCEIDPRRLEAVVSAGADERSPTHGVPHDEKSSADGLEHNSADHSHPIGEDEDHQQMSHGSFDTAAQSDTAIERQPTPAKSCANTTDDAMPGFVVAPPVRPPLG